MSLTHELSKVKSTFNDGLTCRYTYCVFECECVCVAVRKNTEHHDGFIGASAIFFSSYFYPMMAQPSWLWPVRPSAARPRCGHPVPSAPPFNLISRIRPCSWTGAGSSCDLRLTPVIPSLWVRVICLFSVSSCSSTATKWHQISAAYCLQITTGSYFLLLITLAVRTRDLFLSFLT